MRHATMRSDFRGLSWRTLLTLMTIAVVTHQSSHATAGHGDADDAASCRSEIVNRSETIERIGSGAHYSCEEMAGLFQQSVRFIASRLLDPDTLAIVRQDYEMRLCEYRAVESWNESHEEQEELNEFLETLTQSEIPPSDCATHLESAEDTSSLVEGASAIESSGLLRPWGTRFTNGILFASNEPPRRLLVTELSYEEYRPYDFSDVPDSLPDSSVGDLVQHERHLTSHGDSIPSVVRYLRNSLVWSIDSFVASVVRAQEIIDAEKRRAESLLVNHFNEVKPILTKVLGTASVYSESFAAIPKPVVRSVEQQDLRQVFGATILADPFQAEFSVAIKRPPTLAEPLIEETVASRPSVAESSIVNSPESELAAVYELLVLLQSPSWMSDAADAGSDRQSIGHEEIATSEISKVIPEPKSASLLENSGTGVSQR